MSDPDFDEETIEVVEESTASRTYEVPISDVGRDEVSLENAELVNESIHNDPTAYVRRDTNRQVERTDTPGEN